MERGSKIFSGVCCIIVIFLFIISISIPSKSLNDEDIIIKDNYSQTDADVKTYTLKEYNNNLGVFENDEINPTQIIEVDLTALPAYDQEILAQGIRVSSKKDLRQLIEDYSS